MAQSISQEAIGATGLPGATAASRHAGATTSGAPTTGTFAVGDYVVDQSGAMWVCTVAGTPGTWQLSGVSVNENIAGKNAIINGGFDIWQRGTSFTNPVSGTYTADRWVTGSGGSGTMVISQQPLNGAISGSSSKYFMQAAISSVGTISYLNMTQRIENSFTYEGQTVTASFWAKADTNRTINLYVYQNFGSGGSSTVTVVNGQAFNLTTSWAKYSYTFAMPSTSGKTIGTNDLLEFTFAQGAAAYTFSYADVQLEIAPQATSFSRAGGSIGGELALCYRYYYRTTAYNQTTGSTYGFSYLSTPNTAASAGQIYLQPMVPVTMRTNPTALDYNLSNIAVQSGYGRTTITSISVASGNQFFPGVLLASSTNSFTQGQTYVLQDQGSGNGYLGISAEL